MPIMGGTPFGLPGYSIGGSLFRGGFSWIIGGILSYEAMYDPAFAG